MPNPGDVVTIAGCPCCGSSSSRSSGSSSSSSALPDCPCASVNQYQFTLSGLNSTNSGAPYDPFGCVALNTTYTLTRTIVSGGCRWRSSTFALTQSGSTCANWKFDLGIIGSGGSGHWVAPFTFHLSLIGADPGCTSTTCIYWDYTGSSCTGTIVVNGGDRCGAFSGCSCTCVARTYFGTTSYWPSNISMMSL